MLYKRQDEEIRLQKSFATLWLVLFSAVTAVVVVVKTEVDCEVAWVQLLTLRESKMPLPRSEV